MEQSHAIAALAALAQESRLEVFRLLMRAGPDGLPAGGIAGRLNVPAATLSFHLSQLVHAGLARSRREGRSIIYSADVAAMKALVAFLTLDCCDGHPELCGIPPESAPPCCPPEAPSQEGSSP